MGRRLCGRVRLAAEAAALGGRPPAPPPTPSDVTRLVRHARRQARLSQRGLADRAGITRTTIAEIEMGRVDPKAGTLAKLLAACGSRLAVVPAGTGLGGTGLAGTGLAGTGLAGTGLAGTGVAGTGLAGTGLAGTGLTGTGLAGRESAPAMSGDRTGRGIPDGFAERLEREPARRIADAGPAATALVRRVLDAAAASGTEPIVIGELAELVWGARRRPSTVQVCVPPVAAGALARALQPDAPEASAAEIDSAPPGTHGWDDLRRAAVPVRIGYRDLLVASLDDLVRIRQSRLDDDDRRLLPDLEALVTAIEQTERAEAGEHPRFPAHWDVRPLSHLDWLLLRGRVRKVDRELRQRTLTGFCS